MEETGTGEAFDDFNDSYDADAFDPDFHDEKMASSASDTEGKLSEWQQRFITNTFRVGKLGSPSRQIAFFRNSFFTPIAPIVSVYNLHHGLLQSIALQLIF